MLFVLKMAVIAHEIFQFLAKQTKKNYSPTRSPPFRKGGQGGFQRLRHKPNNRIQVICHLRVGEPEHSQPQALQRLIPVGVVLSVDTVLMLRAIHLHHQSGCRGIKATI